MLAVFVALFLFNPARDIKRVTRPLLSWLHARSELDHHHRGQPGAGVRDGVSTRWPSAGASETVSSLSGLAYSNRFPYVYQKKSFRDWEGSRAYLAAAYGSQFPAVASILAERFGLIIGIMLASRRGALCCTVS